MVSVAPVVGCVEKKEFFFAFGFLFSFYWQHEDNNATSFLKIVVSFFNRTENGMFDQKEYWIGKTPGTFDWDQN